MNTNSSECPDVIQHFKEVYPLKQWAAEGLFQESDLMDVDCHWMAFEPPQASVHFLLAFIYIVVFLVGFLSNSFTIYIIASSKKLLTPADILHTNLAISDLMIVLMIPVFIFNSLNQGPAIGKFGCSAYGFLTGLSGTCSVMSLAAIAVERFLAIGRPLKVGRKPTRHWAYFVVISTWLYSSAFASLPFFGVGKYVPEGLLTSCNFNYLSPDWTTKIFILAFFVGAWVVPMIMIIYSYSSIIRAVVQSRRTLSQIASGTPTTASAGIHQQPIVELKVCKVAICLIGVCTLTWTPYAIVALIGISGHGHLLTPLRAVIPALFAKLGTCVDPFIYTLNQPKVRNEISLRLHTLTKKSHVQVMTFRS